MTRYIAFNLAILAALVGCNSYSHNCPYAHAHQVFYPADPVDPPLTDPVVVVCPMPLPDPQQPHSYYIPSTETPQTTYILVPTPVYEIYESEPTFIYVDAFDHRPYRPQPDFHNPPPHRPDPIPDDRPPKPDIPSKPEKPIKPVATVRPVSIDALPPLQSKPAPPPRITPQTTRPPSNPMIANPNQSPKPVATVQPRPANSAPAKSEPQKASPAPSTSSKSKSKSKSNDPDSSP